MLREYRDNAYKFWDGIHKEAGASSVRTDDWLDMFEDMITATSKPVLDLGCGGGNDTLYLCGKGKEVISCDQSQNAIANILKSFPEVKEAKCFNMLDGLPFDDGSFEVVIADLSLHYFTEKDTFAVLSDIKRILVPGGHLILRVNSVNDVYHGAGEGREIEHHLYETDSKMIKRFFDEEDIRYFFKDFEIEFMHEEVMKRYSHEKYLYRVCCRVPAKA